MTPCLAMKLGAFPRDVREAVVLIGEDFKFLLDSAPNVSGKRPSFALLPPDLFHGRLTLEKASPIGTVRQC